MYVPRKYDWIGPISAIMIGYALQEWKGASWDMYVFVRAPLAFVASAWSVYLWKGGLLYQAFETRDEDSEARHAADGAARAWAMDHPEQTTSGNTPVLVPIAGYKHPVEPQPKNDPLWRRMLKREKVKPTASHPAMVAQRYASDSAFPKINNEAMVARTLITQRNHNLLVDLTETYWIKGKHFPESREKFVMIKNKWGYHRIIARESQAHNARAVVVDWQRLRYVSNNGSLTPPPENYHF